MTFLLIGGVVADRLPRRSLMIGSDMIRFAAQAATAAIVISRTARVWEIAALAVVYGFGNASPRSSRSDPWWHRTTPQDGAARPEPGPTIPIGLDLFHNWFRPRGFRYQYGFSTWSGNDGQQPDFSGQNGRETWPGQLQSSPARLPGAR